MTKQKDIVIGCFGAIMIILLVMISLVVLNQPEDPETFSAGLSLSNCTGYGNNTPYDMEVRIYIHGNSNWDVMNLWISNGTQKDVIIEWEGDLVDVLVIYDLLDGEKKKVDIYHLEPSEWRTIILV